VVLDLSEKIKVYRNGDVDNFQETATENHVDDFTEIKEERKDYGEAEVVTFNLTESQDKSLLEDDDAAHSDNKRRGQVLYNEDHNQDSINEAPTADELVQSEDDEFLNECLNRVKPGETLVEARTDSDVQIDRQIYPVVE
jgi:hypothetical protein